MGSLEGICRGGGWTHRRRRSPCTLVRHRHLLLSTANASSLSSSSPLVHLIRLCPTPPLAHSRRPLSRNHQHHSAVAPSHSSAGCCHRIIASHLPPLSPLAHDVHLIFHKSRHHLSSTTGGPPLASALVASRPSPSPSLIRCHRLSSPPDCQTADIALYCYCG